MASPPRWGILQGMPIHAPGPAPDTGPSGPDLPHLLDERSEPTFRQVYASLARRAYAIDTAVAAIRLTGIDLTHGELDGVERIRLLVARVDALALRAEAEGLLAEPRRALTLRHLVQRLRDGRLLVRSAPLAGWTPDFTVFRRSGEARSLLVGLHWFARPFPHRGPALASVHGPAGAALAGRRFEELWGRAHDIGPAVLNLLRRADERGSRAGTGPASAPPSLDGPDRRSPLPRKGPQEKGKPAIEADRDVLDTPTPSG